MDPETIEILKQAYSEVPVGRDRLYSYIKDVHPGISVRTVAAFLNNYEAHQVHRARKNFSQSTTTTICINLKEKYHADLVDIRNISRHNQGAQYFLTVVENSSHYAFVRALHDKTAQEVTRAMEDILNEISTYGPQMKILQSDNGSEFIAQEFQDLLKRYHIRHLKSNPHSPWSNSPVEIFNKSLKQGIYRKFTVDNTLNFTPFINELVDNINNVKCNTTGHKPADVYHERIPFEEVQQKLINKREKIVNKVTNSTHSNLFHVGDTVRISIDILYRFLPDLYKPPGEYRKSYLENWSWEIFTISRVVGKDFIRGYLVSYNGITYDMVVPPHQITKIDLQNLIRMDHPVPNIEDVPLPRERLPERRQPLPVPALVERRLNPTRTQLRLQQNN